MEYLKEEIMDIVTNVIVLLSALTIIPLLAAYKWNADGRFLVALVLSAIFVVCLLFVGQARAASLPEKFVVFVCSANCPPCERMKPQVARAKLAIPIYVVKYEDRIQWCKRHDVERFPTLLQFKHRRVTAKREGYATSQQIIDFYRR